MTYGDKLQRRRVACFLSRRMLADLSGVHEHTIEYIERGFTRLPRPVTKARLEAALREQEARLEKERRETYGD